MMAAKAKALRCLLDVIGGQRDKQTPTEFIDRIPPERFGTGSTRVVRKMVLIAIAASADADGTSAWPSLQTIMRRALVSESTARRTINWLVEHGLLAVRRYAGPNHTNRYEVTFDNPVIVVTGYDDAGKDAGTHKVGPPEPHKNVPPVPSTRSELRPGEPGQIEGQPGHSCDRQPSFRPSLDRPRDYKNKKPNAARSGLAASPSQNHDGEKNWIHTLFAAARVIDDRYGDGLELASLIARLHKQKHGDWPYATRYYMAAMENGGPLDEREDELDGAKKYAIDRLEALLGTDEATLFGALRKQFDGRTYARPVPCAKCGAIQESALALSRHLEVCAPQRRDASAA